MTTLDQRRWRALALLAGSFFMIVLDTSIVTVALPAIQKDLGFDDVGLAWVVNAYVLIFGAALLLGGRAADLFGRRRVFVAGMALFTISSLVVGLATTPELMIGARVAQGLGGALVSPAAMALVTELFTVPAERNKAMGIWGAAAPAGGATGVLLGGVFTDTIGWEWVFYVNVPVGLLVLALTPRLLPVGRVGTRPRLDLAGAATVTGGLALGVYAIMQAQEFGFGSGRVLALFAGAILLLGLFVVVEAKVAQPLVSLSIFRNRNLSAGSAVMFLLGAAWTPAWYYISLYMQQVLGMKSLPTGLGYLPMTLLIMGLSVLFVARTIGRFGFKVNAFAGLTILALGIGWFALVPSNGSYVIAVLLPSIALGIGMAFSYVPSMIASLSEVGPHEAGLASGLINTTYQIGSAIGLAITVAVAAGSKDPASGISAAFWTAGGLAGLAVLLVIFAVRGTKPRVSPATSERESATV